MDVSVEVTEFTSGTEGIAVCIDVAGGGWDSEKTEWTRSSFCIPDGVNHITTLLLKWAH